MEIDGEDVRITFDAEGKPILPELEKIYDLGYGFLGNGITVWNRAEEKDGDYVTVAHIGTDRKVTFYDKDMPHDVKQKIDNVARSPDTHALGFAPAPENIPPRIENAAAPAIVYETIKKVLPESAEPKQTTLDLSLPDPTITISDMNNHGYEWEGMLPLTQIRAVELFDSDHCIYLLYQDNSEAMALDRDEIRYHDGIFGIERADWERSPVRAAQLAVAANIQGNREAELLHDTGNRFGIYQISDGIDEARNFRFASMRELETHGLTVDRANYDLVYTAPFTERVEFLSDRYPVLNNIYSTFNSEHPADYTGRSVSVSDVIVLRYNGDMSTHFVDSAGFVELDNYAFFGEEPVKPQTVETSAPAIQPALSQVETSSGEHTVASVAELEADVKAGKVISLSDLTKAVQAERKPEFNNNSAPKTKPNLMERLEQGKQKASQHGQPDTNKNKHREVE
jgi:hypothetical protein